MNRVKLAPLFSRAERRSFEVSREQSFSAALFAASCSFHSTAALERKRKNQWHYRFNNYGRKRNRNKESKRAEFRNISDYAEFLFQSWREEEERRQPSRRSWFRGHHWVRGNTRPNGFCPNRFHNSADLYPNHGKFTIDSSSSDDEVEDTIFWSTFGGGSCSYTSFYWTDNTSRNFYGNSHKWSYDSNKDDLDDDDDDDDYDERFGTSNTKSEMLLAKQTLGLSISGPLKLEEVKTAYRTCALRWHPDRHHGSTKLEAEEKFKNCSTAYKTLCDSFT